MHRVGIGAAITVVGVLAVVLLWGDESNEALSGTAGVGINTDDRIASGDVRRPGGDNAPGGFVPRSRVRLRGEGDDAEFHSREARNRRVMALDDGAGEMDAAMMDSIEEFSIAQGTKAELREILSDIDAKTEDIMAAESAGELSTLETREALHELEAELEARERALLGDEVYEDFNRQRLERVMRVIEGHTEPNMRVLERDFLEVAPTE